MNEISGGNKEGHMSASCYSCRDPRFTLLRVCPIFWETNRITVQHLINYPGALIQYHLKTMVPSCLPT